MSPDRLRRALQTGATLLGVTFLSSGCIFVHLKGDAADLAMRELAEEHHFDDYGHGESTSYHVLSSPFGKQSTMTIDLDVPTEQLEATFETLSDGVASRIENHGGEIVRFEKESEYASLYTYEKHGETGKVRVEMEQVEGSGGTPYRFVATWIE